MDEFLALLELWQWQALVKEQAARTHWAERFGMATGKQCDLICQLYESAPMPEIYDEVYSRARWQRLTQYDFEKYLDEMNSILNNNQPDPRQQLKTMLRAGTMI